jgi:magnesium chelatase subunit D
LKTKRHVLPFTSIVGQEILKKALILNAINQDLMGVIIKGQRGTAKSMAVRAIAELLPEMEFSIECPYGCSPDPDEPHCDACQEILESGEELKTEKRKIRVVTLPLGATEDRVIGSINIERALKEGRSAFEPGLLAKANRGMLYIDEINLLDDNLVDILLDAAAMGVNTVEREGISITHPAKFILVGTMNPEEGELRPQLTDRLGLYADVKGIEEIEERVKIIEVMEKFDSDPDKFFKIYQNEQEALSQRIVNAVKLLSEVKLQEDLKKLIVKICLDFGIDGHRADILMTRCSKTIAAFDNRKWVEKKDVEEAAKLIIPHRMRRQPFEEEQPIEQKLQQTMEQDTQENERENQNKEDGDNDNDSEDNNKEDSSNEDTPENFNPPPQQTDNHQENGEKEQDSSGKDNSQQAPNHDTEEALSSTNTKAPCVVTEKDKKIRTGRGRRARTLSTHSGKYIKARVPKTPTNDIAIDATIRSSIAAKGKLKIDKEDLREKVREKKKATTCVFVVDASGSMGVGRRMEFAKSAVMSMLEDSYQKRDKVGFIAFRGKKAVTLLKPTNSIYSAVKKLKELPTGGKTPLSAGLIESLKVISTEMEKDKNCIPIMILVSDGKANVAMSSKSLKQEIIEASEIIKKKRINIILIDADEGKFKLGYIKEILKVTNGQYFHINQLIDKDLRKTFGLK